MLQLAPPTRGSSNTAASRATAVGSKTVSASTVNSRSPLANRAAALIAGLRPQRVPWQMTMSTRPSARARSATARVSSVEPSSTTMISTGRKVCWCSEAIERSSPEPPLKVGMITLTEALPAGALISSPHAEQRQRNQRQRIARNVEDQHREGEQKQTRSGQQLHHLEHASHLGRPTGRWPNANAAEIAKRGERPLQAPYRHGTLRVLSGDPPPAPCRSTKARASKRYPGNGSVRACECCGTLQEVMKTGDSGMGHPMSAPGAWRASGRPPAPMSTCPSLARMSEA